MTSRVQVMATAGAAYRFVFTNLWAIVSVTALPFAIVALGDFALQHWFLAAQLAAIRGEPTLPPIVMTLAALAWNIVQAGIIGMAGVALHRMVLYGERHPRLELGRREYGFVIVSLIVGAIYGLATFLPGLAMPPPGQVPDQGAVIALYLAQGLNLLLLVLWLRFSLVFPILVAEGRVDFARAWGLTRWKWGEMIGVYVLIGLPVVVLAAVGILLLKGLPRLDDPAGAMEHYLLASQRLVWADVGLGFVVGVLSTALGVAVLSYSYKQLTGHRIDEVAI